MKTRPSREQGSVLIATVIVTFLVLAITVQYNSWITQTTKKTVRQVASYKALVNADSGVQAALQYLRSPKAAELEPGKPLSRISITEGTTFYLTFTRQESDRSLVDVQSAGYFQLAAGSFKTNTGVTSQMGEISARVQLRSIGDYFAASPGDLQISYGSNISSGMVYGKNLIFESGNIPPRTVLKAASYVNSIFPANYFDYVTFTDVNQPLHLTSAPNLPTLDDSLRNEYRHLAGQDILPDGTVLSGPQDGPNNAYKVYFSEGDVTLGAPGEKCTVNKSFLIYSKKDIYIANTVETIWGGSAWPALLAEGNIYITDTAPDSLEINATMVTMGRFKALGNPRVDGRLKIVGGIITGTGVFLGNIYTQKRNYVYQAPDPTLPLPFTTQVIRYNVTRGKYN